MGEEEGADTGAHPGLQSGDLSLVQIHPDTVLRLVGNMVLLRHLSYVIKTQLKPSLVGGFWANATLKDISCVSVDTVRVLDLAGDSGLVDGGRGVPQQEALAKHKVRVLQLVV